MQKDAVHNQTLNLHDYLQLENDDFDRDLILLLIRLFVLRQHTFKNLQSILSERIFESCHRLKFCFSQVFPKHWLDKFFDAENKINEYKKKTKNNTQK